MSFIFVNLIILTGLIRYKFNLSKTLILNLILFSPFYTISLLNIKSITYNLKIPEYFSIIIIIFYFLKNKKFSLLSFYFTLLIILIMFISYFARTIYFLPVEVWEIEVANRMTIFDKFTIKNSLNITNITQMLYIILGLLIFIIMSSIKINKFLIEKYVKLSLLIVLIIGIIQLLFYYTNIYDIYLKLFYSIDPNSENSRLIYQVFFGIKRINSVLVEPSIFGYYVCLTIFFLYLFDKNFLLDFKNKLLILFSLIMILLSTSFTGYIGIILLIFYGLLYNKKYKTLTFIFLFILIISSSLYYIYYFEIQQIIELKNSSTSERLLFGITLPFQSLQKMPFFGLALGTDRPSIMIVNLIVSFGLVGVFLLFLFGRIIVRRREVKFFIIFLFTIGISIPDFHYIFFWIYFGLLVNSYYIGESK